MKKNNFNLFNSFLIITLLVLISVPFSISFNKSEKLNIKKNVASAETNLQIAQRELNEAKANLNKVQIIIRDLNTKLSEDKANNLNTTELEAQITSLVNIVENAARAAVVAAEKKVFIEQTLSDSLVSISPVNKSKNESIYKLLAPIGGITCMDSSGQDPKCITNDIGKYLNIIFKLAIGISAALAVIMLIINGVKYMGDESVFGKTEAKKQMFGAIVGLLIALGSWALLNTINPALTGQNGLSISSANVEIVDLPDSGDNEIDPGFANNDLRYSVSEAVSPGVVNALIKLKDGWSIRLFKIYTNKRMLISLQKGTEVDNTNVIGVEVGLNGFSELNTGKITDNKTPKGTWKILEVRTSPKNKPVYSTKGSNMGASFWLLSPTIKGERGIGMHGNKNGTLTKTNGCIRLKNSDILALLPYIKTNISVIIGN